MRSVYLDYNATTPLHPAVLEGVRAIMESSFANPASDHIQGLEAKKLVDTARGELADLIGAKENEIIFTSGATEADNLAILGVARKTEKKHIIISSIEHPAVLEPCRRLEQLGYRITYLPVDTYGLVHPETLDKAIDDQTALVSTMYANNEIGTIQNIKALADIAKAHGALFHSDAAQAVGYEKIKVDDLGVDLLSISGHKFYGPKGIGALFVRTRLPRVSLEPIAYGGGQERSFRSGTLNVPSIVGLGIAAKLAKKEYASRKKHLTTLSFQLKAGITSIFPRAVFHGHPTNRLVHNISVELPGIDNKWLSLKLKDYCFSTGSACSTFHDHPSHVLQAIGLSNEKISNCIRLGVGYQTTTDEIDRFLKALQSILTTTVIAWWTT